jgi:hypothetical protein
VAGRYQYCLPGNGTTGTSGVTIPWALRQVTRPLTVIQFSLSMGGSSAAPGMLVSLNIYSTASTGGAAGALAKWPDLSAPSPTTTGRVGDTAEGTLVASGPQWYIQPFGGVLDIQYPLMREPGLDAVNTGYVALVIANQAIGFPYAGYALIDEG